MKHIKTLANAIRFLAVDAIHAAQSGHPGMPLGLADVMAVLYLEKLKHEPTVPSWVHRDRVVLSNGHGSMLLYAALHLSGYPVSIDDIKRFRQMDSVCAGHPEYDAQLGIEATTGPLGQGLGMAVGMAVGIKRRVELGVQDPSNVYCFVGDGCLMEGISHEAASLAPHLLEKGLIILWDDNGISIDGHVRGWMEQNVCERFESYGYHVIPNVDAHDPMAVSDALDQAAAVKQLVFIQLKSVIGKGCSRVEGSEVAHGQPLKRDDIKQMRTSLNWPYAPFEIPQSIRSQWDRRHQWPNAVSEPESKPLEINIESLDWQRELSTRQASALVIKRCIAQHPEIVGGSADLAASTLTNMDEGVKATSIDYGVREFGMFAIANGLSLAHMIPFVGTFLVFLDYGKSALRLAALMKVRVVYVLTHDSVALGEDGPTHQPVEHLSSIRAMPNVELWRPCNLLETAVAWQQALLKTDQPTVLALSRQTIPSVPLVDQKQVAKGYYHLIKVHEPVGQLLLLALRLQ